MNGGIFIPGSDLPFVTGPVHRHNAFKSCKGVVGYLTIKTHFYLVHPVDCRLEFLRCINGYHFSSPYDADPVTEPVGLLHIMSREKNGGSLFIQITEQGEDHNGALHIKTACGFIEEEELRFMDERHRKDEPLFHSFGVRLYLLVFAFKEAHHAEQVR